MYLGGFPAHREVWEVDTRTCIISNMEPMKEGRHSFGLARYKRVLYVFGGFEGSNPISHCEKLQVNAT
jgi:hypothetical protein